METKKTHRFRKSILVALGIIILLMVLVIVFISPITKYLIEKYDVKYMGREIKLNYAYVNPFTGYIYLSDIKVYEEKSDSIFLSANSLSGHVAMRKLISKTYEISDLTLDHPWGTVMQNKKEFNFDDIVAKFTKKDTPEVKKGPLHLSFVGIKIIEGEFHYHEKTIPVNYFIKNVNIESSGKWWDVDTMDIKFDFLSGIGKGKIKGIFNINTKNNDYNTEVTATEFDLNVIGQFLKDITNYGHFAAVLDGHVLAKGNFNNKEDITTKGDVAVSNFHFGKNPHDDYASFDKFVLSIVDLSPKKHVYNFDSASLTHPYFKYERYDYLDNIQTMFGKKGANVKAVNNNSEKFNLVLEIAKYVKVLARNFFRSNYKINRVAIYKADLHYNDYTLNEKFSMELNPLYAHADSIDKSHSRVKVFLKSGIKPYGNLNVALSINPKDSSDFDIDYHFTKIPITMFNPYLINYTSFPLDRGTIELNGKWDVRKGNIQSDNHLLVIDPRLNERLKNDNTKWIPMKIVMFFIREKGNVIDYQVPITGDLNNPKFHLKNVIFGILTNIFVKPVSTPYTVQVRTVETEIEKSLSLKWETKSTELENKQQKFMEKVAGFLNDDKNAAITVTPMNYSIKEKEYLLFFEAKKKYYLANDKMNLNDFHEKDSLEVDKMSVKDSVFMRYIESLIKDTMAFTIQEKCEKYVNPSVVSQKYNRMNKDRKDLFLSYFKDNDLAKRVKFKPEQNIVPYNGFSFYKIEYKGEYPPDLRKAYDKMNQLNSEVPRDKYKEERKKRKAAE